MEKSRLVADAISKSFTQGESIIPVIRSLTVSFEYGKTYAITGVSGSGKSTLMHMLAGIDAPDTGVVRFNGQDLSSFSPEQHRLFLLQSVGLVFQRPHLLKELSVLENIILKDMLAQSVTSQTYKKGRALLSEMGLEDKADAHPLSLSGGQQQRVAIARALFNKPAFLLADEPTGNLDAQTAKRIVSYICACQKEWGMGVIISSHDIHVADAMQIVYRLEKGRLKALG